jgi:hypothetical protein
MYEIAWIFSLDGVGRASLLQFRYLLEKYPESRSHDPSCKTLPLFAQSARVRCLNAEDS